MSISLYEDVREYTIDHLSGPDLRITSEAVTAGYISARKEAGEFLALIDARQASAEYGGVIQIARAVLRKLVPEAPEPDDSQLAMELPEDKLLQKHYSIRGEGDDNYYVKREELTEDEMLQVVSRLRKVAVNCERHAKALESSWYREHEPVEV